LPEIKLNKSKSIFEEILFFLLSNFIAAIIGILTSIVIARILGPEKKGIITAALVIPNLILFISTLGIRQSIIFFTGKKKFQDHEILSSIFYFLIVFSAAGIIINYFVFKFSFGFSKDLSLFSILLLLTYIPLRLTGNYLNSFFIGKSRFKIVNALKWGGSSIYLLLILLFVYFLKFDFSGIFVSLNLLAAITILFLFSALIFKGTSLKFRNAFRFHKDVWRQMLVLGFLYAIAFVVIQLNLRVDVLFLKYFRNNAEVGYYSIAVAISEMIWQFPLAMSIVIMSKTANSENINKTVKDINIIFKYTATVVILMGVLLYFVAPYIIPFFYSTQFNSSIVIVQTIIPGIICFAIMIILTSYIIGIGKPKVIIIIGLPALIINMILNYFFIPLWGGVGAAIATDISYFIALVCTVVYYARSNNILLHELILFQKEDFSVLLKYFRNKFQ
jgi:O-antigen/teichoic acid export membrane protein